MKAAKVVSKMRTDERIPPKSRFDSTSTIFNEESPLSTPEISNSLDKLLDIEQESSTETSATRFEMSPETSATRFEMSPETSYDFQEDPIFLQILQDRGTLVDTSDDDHVEKMRRVYSMIKNSKHYQRMYKDRAIRKWETIVNSKADDSLVGPFQSQLVLHESDHPISKKSRRVTFSSHIGNID
jgi:hypothetical protein